jgi:hypothetical protein
MAMEGLLTYNAYKCNKAKLTMEGMLRYKCTPERKFSISLLKQYNSK